VSEPSTDELAEIRSWVSARVRRLVDQTSDRDDIVAIIMSDYWTYRCRSDAKAAERVADGGARKGLAAQIVKWRIADHYRSRVSTSGFIDPDELRAGNVSPYRATLQGGIVKEIFEKIRRLPERDRALLLREVLTNAPELALTVAERRQLSRLRARLAKSLHERHGESLFTLLDEDQDNHDGPE